MNAIRNVLGAFGNLAASVNALAGVLDLATGRLRQQLALDRELAPILEHQTPAGVSDEVETTPATPTAKGRRK